MKLIKRIIFVFFFIYTFDIFAIKYGVVIPINLVTLLIVFLFDVPGMFLLLLLLKVM